MTKTMSKKVRKAFTDLDAETTAEFKDAYYKAAEGLQAMLLLTAQLKKHDPNFSDLHGVTMTKAMKPVVDAFNSLDDAVFGEVL